MVHVASRLKSKTDRLNLEQYISPARIYTHQTCWKGAFHALPLQDVRTCQLMAPQMQLTNAARFWPPNCMVPQYHVVLCGVICESSTCISNELAVKTWTTQEYVHSSLNRPSGMCVKNHSALIRSWILTGWLHRPPLLPRQKPTGVLTSVPS